VTATKLVVSRAPEVATGATVAEVMAAVPQAEEEAVVGRSATNVVKWVTLLVPALRLVAIATAAVAVEEAIVEAVVVASVVVEEEARAVDRPATHAAGMVTTARIAPRAVDRSATTVARLATSPASAQPPSLRSASATAASSQATSKLNARTRRQVTRSEAESHLLLSYQSYNPPDLGHLTTFQLGDNMDGFETLLACRAFGPRCDEDSFRKALYVGEE